LRDTRKLAGLVCALLVVCMLFGCGQTQSGTQTQADQTTTEEETQATETEEATEEETTEAAEAETTADASAYVSAWQPRDGYTLKQVVAVSRHNLRAPQDKNMDTLAASTTHEWVDWTAAGSELTKKGGVAETIMGEFFRNWLEDEGLIPANYIPEDGAVRFYSNPRQRTLATTQYFSSGMLPVANVEIEYHGDYDSRDPVFMPRFGYVSDSLVEAATAEIAGLGGDEGVAGLDADLQESYDLITEVMDYKNSQAYKDGGSDLTTGDCGYEIAVDAEPKVTGSLSTANVFSDALTLQYYQAADVADAAFGKELTWDQWKLIAAPKDVYGDQRYNSRLVAIDCARLLANEVDTELGLEGRVFTFMCGHDSNQSSLLHAIGVSNYELPDTFETKTPIGGKVLFEVWENASGEQFCNIRYAYATSEQVRNLSMLSLETPPASFDLDFEDLERNEDGLFTLQDVKQRLQDVTSYYESLPEVYPEEGEAELAEAA